MECCRYYYSWVLAMLMWQQSMQIHTFPKVMFKAENFTVTGYSCMPDKVSQLPSTLPHCWILCPPCHTQLCVIGLTATQLPAAGAPGPQLHLSNPNS